MAPQTVADLEGPSVEPDGHSSLIDRCRRGWNVPVAELTNELLATFVRQRLGLVLVIPEAQRRVAEGYLDGTELFDEELETALEAVTQP